jgi:ABC-type transport system substrate-binding protein
MSIDRDTFIDAFYNVPTFQKAGVDMTTAWSAAVRCDSSAGWWLNPQGKDFGDNAKFFKHDVQAAKQLLSAAGFASGLDVDAHHITTGDYGPDFAKKVLALLGMVPDSGLRVHSVPANFQTDWQQKYRDVKGNFDGMAFVLEVGATDVGDTLYALYNSNGSQFMGFDPDGKGTFKGDPTLDELTNKMKGEFDANKRHSYAYELQKYEGKMQYYPRFPGGANGFNLVWPAVENWGVFRGTAAQGTGGFFPEYYLWMNDQKAPLKKG